MTQKNKESKNKMIGAKIAAITAGAAALGAGAYYLLGPNAKSHQKNAKAWMIKMEKEAQKNVAKLRSASKPIYNKLVDSLTENYSKQYKQHAPEIKSFAKRLKGEWKVVKKVAKPIIKAVKKSSKK